MVLGNPVKQSWWMGQQRTAHLPCGRGGPKEKPSLPPVRKRLVFDMSHFLVGLERDMNEQPPDKIERIARIFPDRIENVQIHDNGEDSTVLEINGEWMFRFPRHKYGERALEAEKRFLPRFAPMSPLPIPNPRYIGGDFIGYPKIQGVPFTNDLLQALLPTTRRVVARQIGEFLSKLHAFPLSEATAMGVQESWGGWREKAFQSFKENVAPRLSPQARAGSLDFFDRFFSMECHHVLIHGDFYPPDHVFFDQEQQQLSGVIDFSDLTIEDIATDFQCVYADFGATFFREVLMHYAGDADGQLVERIQIRIRAHPLFDAVYALEYHQPERFEKQLTAIENSFGDKTP